MNADIWSVRFGQYMYHTVWLSQVGSLGRRVSVRSVRFRVRFDRFSVLPPVVDKLGLVASGAFELHEHLLIPMATAAIRPKDER